MTMLCAFAKGMTGRWFPRPHRLAILTRLDLSGKDLLTAEILPSAFENFSPGSLSPNQALTPEETRAELESLRFQLKRVEEWANVNFAPIEREKGDGKRAK